MSDESASKAKKLKKDESPSVSESAKAEADKNVQTLPPQQIEQQRNKPEEGNEEAETVVVNNKPNLQVGQGESAAPMKTPDEEPEVEKEVKKSARKAQTEACWNCGAGLDKDGDCDTCGFKKSIMFNQNLEAERERKRLLTERGY